MKTVLGFLRRIWVVVWACGLGLGCWGVALGGETEPLLIGSWRGFRTGLANAVAVLGNHAFVTAGNVGLQVIDISNPANPESVGGFDTGGNALGVAVSRHYAYVAGQFLSVRNRRLPQRPRVVVDFPR